VCVHAVERHRYQKFCIQLQLLVSIMSVSISDLRTEIEKNQLESLIPNPTILEKCKRGLRLPSTVRINYCDTNDEYFIRFLGVALCNRYPQTIMEFLGRLEAFLMNSNVQTLSLDLVGSFEQSLYKDLNVSLIAPSYIEISLL